MTLNKTITIYIVWKSFDIYYEKIDFLFIRFDFRMDKI